MKYFYFYIVILSIFIVYMAYHNITPIEKKNETKTY